MILCTSVSEAVVAARISQDRKAVCSVIKRFISSLLSLDTSKAATYILAISVAGNPRDSWSRKGTEMLRPTLNGEVWSLLPKPTGYFTDMATR